MDRDKFLRHLERASEIVSGWPAWKQNVLRDAIRPQREEPRQMSKVERHEFEKYRGHYADTDRAELIKKLRAAHERCRFIPPAKALGESYYRIVMTCETWYRYRDFLDRYYTVRDCIPVRGIFHE